MTTVTLSNQASFSDFFKKFSAGEIADAVIIKFELPKNAKEIPFLQIKGKGYNGTINSLVMNVLQTHQTNINRLYSLATYGEVQKLKASEVESLRIIVQVNKGSSIFNIENLGEILKFITLNPVNRKTAIILTAGILINFTDFGLNNYRDNQNRIFIAEQNQLDRDHTAEQNQLHRDHTAEQNQLDRDFTAEQNQLDRDAREREREVQIIKEIDECNQIIAGSEAFLEKLVKLSKHADVVEHSGHTISPSVEKEEKEIFPTNISENYKILRVDAEKDNYFRVRLESVATGDKFNAKLSTNVRHANMRPIISAAVLSGNELHLNIDAFLVDNKIDSAVIVSIVEPEQLTTNN